MSAASHSWKLASRSGCQSNDKMLGAVYASKELSSSHKANTSTLSGLLLNSARLL